MIAALVLLLSPACLEGATTTPPVSSEPFTPPTFDPRAVNTTTPEDTDQRFHCSTRSCSLSDEWVAVPFANSSEICEAAHTAGYTAAFDLYRQCRVESMNSFSFFTEQQCRIAYCDIFESFLQTIAPTGGPEYYGGSDCERMLHFNRTLCQTFYRDTDLFCNCLCPTMGLVSELDGCEELIVPFLFFGRRGLIERYPLEGFCAQQLAEWLSPLADPRDMEVDHEVITNPETCTAYHIPYPTGHFRRILEAEPFNPCPWQSSTGELNILECSDGTLCDIDVDGWGCCQIHHQRFRCPANFPVMCSQELECAGQTDFCCAESAEDCNGGRERPCSPLLEETLDEWEGVVPPGVRVPGIATTTDPWLAFFASTTEPPPSFWEEIKHVWPPVLGALAVLGIASTAIICILMGRYHHNGLRRYILGTARYFLAVEKEPVHVFRPSGELPPDLKKLREGPIQPPIDWRLVEAARADHVATERLKSTVAAIRGLNGARFGIGKDGETLPEADALESAVAEAQKRGLDAEQMIADLIAEAETWMRTRRSERTLDRALCAAADDLPAAGKQLSLPTSVGGFGFGTAEGIANEAFLKQSAWKRIEALRDALKAARAERASDLILARGDQLLEQLLARTAELPAECCIPDPDGKGVMLLPTGRKRATWGYTGDPYTYMEGGDADELGDDMPTEELDAAPVDAARPLCAAFLKGKCHMGSECGWRHGHYVPGDVVREPVLQELDF